MTIGLIDRDIFLKLACIDLWDEVLGALQIEKPYRLPSTSSMRSSKTLLERRKMPADVLEAACVRLQAMVDSVEVVPVVWLEAAQRHESFNRLVDISDEGEAGLTAIALEIERKSAIITGDKRHVVALERSYPEAREALKGRLFTFEDCVLAATNAHGFEYVKMRALPAVGCDGTLRVALGSGSNTKEASFRDALLAYG